ncbi:MAG TPA: tRNA pseudouridine(38-40) synthase TruA [Epulopiscium sp.]|nr:tRNA pseudouridine(38-40) synthase TruA [Candidatus Epulonipiscium sp.]
MANYKLIIAYDGTRYKGWQRLADSEDTVQGKIETVLSKMTKEKIQIIGAGRTDGGSHARAQVASFHTDFKTTQDDIFKYLNAYLPKDISVIGANKVDPRFHAKFNATSLRYVYQLRTGLTSNPFDRQYRLHIAEKLNYKLMDEACKHFLGTHDFQSFTSRKSKTKSNERTLTRLELVKNGNDLDIVFEGSGFLHNMVRIITGTLIEIGQGKRSPSDIKNIFAAKSREVAGYTVSPQGMFLDEVIYEPVDTI